MKMRTDVRGRTPKSEADLIYFGWPWRDYIRHISFRAGFCQEVVGACPLHGQPCDLGTRTSWIPCSWPWFVFCSRP